MENLGFHRILYVMCVLTLDGLAIKECVFEQLASLYIKNKYIGKMIGVKGCV